MKKTFSILLIAFSTFSFSQKKKQKNIPPPPSFDLNNRVSKNFKPTPFEVRVKNFPFSKAIKVKIISYNLDFKKEPIYTPPPPKDSVAIQEYVKRKISVKISDIISGNFNEVSQQKNLNISEIKELTNIIYNTCGKYSSGVYSQNGCFFPRNAILFYDENDTIFAHIEICFQCGTRQENPEGLLGWESLCNEMDADLEVFFNKIGIKTEYSKIQ